LLILIKEGRQAMEINDVLPRSQILVKDLTEGLNAGNSDLQGVEKRIPSGPFRKYGDGFRQSAYSVQHPHEAFAVPVTDLLG
jgi:hypothetical protein